MKHIGKNIILPGVMLAGSFAVCGVLAAAAETYGSDGMPHAAMAYDPGFLARARAMDASGNYQGVIDQLQHISAEGIGNGVYFPAEAAEEAAYLRAKAYYELGDSRAVAALRGFVADYPASTRAVASTLLIGDHYFFRGDYSAALEVYKSIELSTLNGAERNLYTYRKGICMLRRGYFSEARPLFRYLAGRKGWRTTADYYDAYIDYVEGNDGVALEKFKTVAETQRREAAAAQSGNPEGMDESLHPQYYIAQLLFRQGDWDGCISTARNLLKRGISDEEMAASTYRVLGISRYEKGDLAGARGSLESYVNIIGDNVGDDALYALGACEYEAGDYTVAATRFSRLLDSRDAIAQGSHLYLGQIEAARGNASAAAINFEKAYRMNFDPKVAEAALYNYAAAASRGGNIPFDRSADMLERFVKNYPSSEYAAAIERYLGRMYFGKGDYTAAIAALDRIVRPDADDRALLATVLYEAGAASVSEKRYVPAVQYLRRCVGLRGIDPELRCQANIWLGDALYARKQYAEASKAWSEALNSGKAGVNAPTLTYDYAYSLLMQNRFGQAARYFERVGEMRGVSSRMKRDAAMRRADCRYYAGDYAGAKAGYAEMMQVGSDGTRGADYAAYRYAQLLGIDGNVDEKLKILEGFDSRYPKSDMMADVLEELSDTYASMGRQDKAAEALSRRLSNYGGDASAEDYINLAEYSFNAGDHLKALEAYLKVEQTGTPEYLAEARAGIMRCADTQQMRIEYARKLMETPGVDSATRDEAEMLIGEHLLRKGATSREGTEILKRLAENPFTEAGAHSAVILGQYLLEKGNPDEAVRLMEEFTSSGSGREYWVARGFIVLADAYTAQGKDYLAKEYLTSLRDNYPGREEDIRSMIEKRLK